MVKRREFNKNYKKAVAMFNDWFVGFCSDFMELVLGHKSMEDFESFKLNLILFFGMESSINEETFLKTNADELVMDLYREVQKLYKE